MLCASMLLVKKRHRHPIIQQQRRDADGIKSKPVPKVKSSATSFVKRNGRFVLASKVNLIAGETLYWHRKRQFGIDEKFIAFGKA
jgi:hypothetical protein